MVNVGELGALILMAMQFCTVGEGIVSARRITSPSETEPARP
jgi:hypothetical protein